MKTTQMHMYLFSISHIFLIYSLVFIECKKRKPIHTGRNKNLFTHHVPTFLLFCLSFIVQAV